VLIFEFRRTGPGRFLVCRAALGEPVLQRAARAAATARGGSGDRDEGVMTYSFAGCNVGMEAGR
jgi:hypothetical protein